MFGSGFGGSVRDRQATGAYCEMIVLLQASEQQGGQLYRRFVHAATVGVHSCCRGRPRETRSYTRTCSGEDLVQRLLPAVLVGSETNSMHTVGHVRGGCFVEGWLTGEWGPTPTPKVRRLSASRLPCCALLVFGGCAFGSALEVAGNGMTYSMVSWYA